ncbi:MAG: sugar ABC transporter permease, partial [Oscillospiraceae bacterium]|nr:sugar ABC transporter permease [Oscillospiraceae bacterium]
MTRNAARGRLLSPAGRVGDMVYRTWMLWPALVLLAIFFIGPILMALYYSFTNLALSGSAAGNLRFTGLANYSRLMKDSDMLSSIRATLLFLMGSVVGQTVLGFFMALLMKGKS